MEIPVEVLPAEIIAKRRTYAGLFIVGLATLMYEILLTRIFSVTLWYHFAFMTISIAMFGLTVGGLWVYLHPDFAHPERAKYHMARSSLFFAAWIVVSFTTHLWIPVSRRGFFGGVTFVALTYVVISIPFVYSGICGCLALTKFPSQLSRLYAADLAGAASGCVLLIYTLRITDGITAVFVTALLASIAAGLFASEGGFPGLRRLAFLSCGLLAIFVVGNTILVARQKPFLRLNWVKEIREPIPLYEKWNSFSRITVLGDPKELVYPMSEGISKSYTWNHRVRELRLTIDASAETTLTGFAWDLKTVEHLKYDVKEFVHYLRPKSRVLVVGAGGGRDVLAALAFGQETAQAVEINEDIINTVNQRFGDFTGHLDRDPRVRFINDEARSYVARTRERFDIIQVSFIDTWAATAAGAYALTENSLYTVEAWKILLARLTPNGILSFSRWYYPGRPTEAYRLTSLAAATLGDLGIVDPSQHIILVHNLLREGKLQLPAGAATILVSKSPFSSTDLDKAEETCKRMQFDIDLSPRGSLDSTFSSLASGKGLESIVANFPSDISAPTDDRPFFFQDARFRDLFNPARGEQRIDYWNSQAVFTLVALLVIVLCLTGLCILVPLGLATRGGKALGGSPYIVYFAAIGLGFMLVEVSQMQRLIVFLGHPTYALSVVLLTLLLSSGLGSYTTYGISDADLRAAGAVRLVLLLGVLIIFCILTPRAMVLFQRWGTPERILVASGILIPPGFFMGMAFPIGMKMASRESLALLPWLWGINGATSVCASVLAVVIALGAGISISFWVGLACYGLALGSYLWATFRRV